MLRISKTYPAASGRRSERSPIAPHPPGPWTRWRTQGWPGRAPGLAMDNIILGDLAAARESRKRERGSGGAAAVAAATTGWPLLPVPSPVGVHRLDGGLPVGPVLGNPTPKRRAVAVDGGILAKTPPPASSIRWRAGAVLSLPKSAAGHTAAARPFSFGRPGGRRKMPTDAAANCFSSASSAPSAKPAPAADAVRPLAPPYENLLVSGIDDCPAA